MAHGLDPRAAGIWEKIGYQPFKQQQLYHASSARFRLANCGRRFGKSTMAGRDLEPRLFQPNKRYWIVGPTYELGEKEFRVVWDDLLVKMQLGLDKRIKRSYNKKQGNMYIEFPWQTRLEVRSADHPENLVGDSLDGVIMSEAAKHKEDTWTRFIRPALADKRGWADFPTTPEGFNWMYQLWMFGQDKTFPDYASWRFPSWANTEVYPGGEDDPEIILLKRTMSPESFAQEIAAEFGAFQGKIYPEWDVETHVGNVEFRPELPNYMAIDWGYTNPAAFVEFQITPDDRVRVWRIHYKAYTPLAEHIKIMQNRDQPPGYHLDLAFADAADPEAAEYVSANFVPCIADPNAKTNWREGVDVVRSFMRMRETGLYDEWDRPIEVPALQVDYSCAELIDEFNNYKAPSNRTGNNVPEVGQKAKDHALDAIRYGLVHIYKLGALYHLSDVMGDQVNIQSASSSSSSSSQGPSPEFSLTSSSAGGGFFTQGGVF
jgi:hypothetical protein